MCNSGFPDWCWCVCVFDLVTIYLCRPFLPVFGLKTAQWLWHHLDTPVGVDAVHETSVGVMLLALEGLKTFYPECSTWDLCDGLRFVQ